MATITINILRNDIYSVAEGISVSISQHNGGTPAFEQLWASPDEAKKLDIYYREAISDLERHLTEWIQQTSAKYKLAQDGTDYALTLIMSPHWPVNMQGLLANKIQDYLVHAVTAGWLNDFEGLSIKQDYQAMSTQDIADIRDIIYLRAFNFTEAERSDDATVKDGSAVLTPDSRQEDVDKEPPLLRPETGFRRKDNVIKQTFETPTCLPDNLRHRDNAIVEHVSDYTDWSGADIDPQAILLYHDCHRIQKGRGYTPSPLDKRPVSPASPVTTPDGFPVEEEPSRHTKHHHKDPRIPDFPTHPNYPPIFADGKGWSDEALYDAEGSEHFVNGKCHNKHN